MGRLDASPERTHVVRVSEGYDWHDSETLKGVIACERVNLKVTAANVHGEVVGEEDERY
jgi:hypothetical protein